MNRSTIDRLADKRQRDRAHFKALAHGRPRCDRCGKLIDPKTGKCWKCGRRAS